MDLGEIRDLVGFNGLVAHPVAKRGLKINLPLSSVMFIDFPISMPIYSGVPIAMFEYQTTDIKAATMHPNSQDSGIPLASIRFFQILG